VFEEYRYISSITYRSSPCLTAIVAAASAIAALTPTPTDDSFVAKAYKIVDWLALNVGKAKDK